MSDDLIRVVWHDVEHVKQRGEETQELSQFLG